MTDMQIAGAPLHGRTGHEAGRALLARLYHGWTGEDLPRIQIGPNGKPYFPNSPLHFSITHTTAHAFCVLSTAEVGIDAEELDRPVKLSLARRILSPTELAQFEAAEDQHRALLTFWVLKEAAAKATGEGIRGFPNKTAFSLDDPRVTVMDGCLVAVIHRT